MKLKRPSTYATIVPNRMFRVNVIMMITSTLPKPLSRPPRWNTAIKLSKFRKLFGRAIELLELNSSVDLKALMITT
ncbi:hypothetical protein D3C80_2024130 [compost metagenome]